MKPRPLRSIVPPVTAIVLLVATMAACASSGPTARHATATTGAVTTTTIAPRPVPLAVWTDCKNGLQCARVVVPLDYARPGEGTMTVGLTRLAASDPGPPDATMFFDTGGPGISGDEALRALESFIPLPLRQHLDVVAMSRRGTGTSGKLTCGPTPAAITAAPLADIAGLARLYERGLPSCRTAERVVGDLSTITAARDLDRARQAMGLAQIEYLGLSYGTLLGDTYVQLFPNRVKAMVLDGAVDPTESLLAEPADMAPIDERDLTTALAGCAAQGAACPLGPDPAATYAQVRARLTAHPEPGSPPVTDGDLAAATLMYLTVPSFTDGFFGAVAAAAKGDGSKLRAIAVGNYQDIDGTTTIGPYWATTCDDSPTRPSAAQLAATAAAVARRYPDTGAEAVAYAAAGCAGWPAATRPLPSNPAKGAPPVVVIGGTNDPQTPVAWARRMVAELGPGVGRLVVRQSTGHTAFLNNPGPCIVDLEVRDLVDGMAPPALTTCTR